VRNSGYDDGYPYYANYGYDHGDGGCYVVQRRILTRYGVSIQPVQVCNQIRAGLLSGRFQRPRYFTAEVALGLLVRPLASHQGC